jgi:hypothetical protein
MDVKSPIFGYFSPPKKRPEIPSIAIHGFWIPAIPAGMTIFRICVDTYALREKVGMRGFKKQQALLTPSPWPSTSGRGDRLTNQELFYPLIMLHSFLP